MKRKPQSLRLTTAFRHVLSTTIAAIAIGALGCADTSSTSAPFDAEKVKADVREIARAVYEGDIDATLGLTHPKIIEALGGVESTRRELEKALISLRRLEMKLESIEFPNKPTFLPAEVNDYVIVPTRSIISSRGRRGESFNFQFGARRRGEVDWKYVEGSRVSKVLSSLFPDFPKDFKFPLVQRKLL
jgi:hypothetical protein